MLLIILAMAVYYYQRDDNNSVKQQSIDLSNQPIYQSDNMETVIYDLLGNLSYKITATNVKYFENVGNTEFQDPNIILYNQNNAVTWYIIAKHATLTHNKILYLNENVVLTNQLADSQIKEILTDTAKVNLTTQVITSDCQVTIQGVNFTSTGVGLLGNLRNKTADILENVKTYYNATNTQTNNTTN